MPIGIVFPHDNHQPLVQREFESLEDYQAAVDGYVESINTPLLDVAFFASEEAKLIGLGIDRRATLFWWLHCPPASARDIIAGDAVLVGPIDRTGDVCDVPEYISHLLFTAAAFAVEVRVADSTKWYCNETVFHDCFEAAHFALDLVTRRRELVSVRVVASS